MECCGNFIKRICYCYSFQALVHLSATALKWYNPDAAFLKLYYNYIHANETGLSLLLHDNKTVVRLPAPCSSERYILNVQPYSEAASLMLYYTYKPMRQAFVFFRTTDVATYTEVPKVNFNNAVSAIGGGLGLFLGFSCISLISQAIKWLNKEEDSQNEVQMCST